MDETDSSNSLVKAQPLWFGISYVIVIYVHHISVVASIYSVDEQKGMKEVKDTIYAICGIKSL